MKNTYAIDEKKAFLGKGWAFPVRFNWETKDLDMVTAESDIEESLFILLNTIKKERIMRPDYGHDLLPLVFEKMDNSLYHLLEDSIKKAITLYESRIDLTDVNLQQDISESLIHIELSYTVRKTNSRHNIVFPFYLSQGTYINPLETTKR